MRLEQRLVLARFFTRLLGAESFDDLKAVLYPLPEGPTATGASHFFTALARRPGLGIKLDQLRAYDARIMAYEARLARARGDMRLRYFQYLCLLYTEMYLDRLTTDPEALLNELNHFASGTATFTQPDLRRLAFFLATGSGKTLLMHVGIWQVLHYLRVGCRPDALVRRADGRREFNSILLITPGEGLSQQHLHEFSLSGIPADHLTAAGNGSSLEPDTVKVIEIHKLAEVAPRGGDSIPLDALLSTNLVLVDEGHKGTGSEARAWKSRQQRISGDGFLLEYSATFAQAIGAAGARSKEALLAEYGKAILFDYSYRFFHRDGYGKDFRVYNLARGTEGRAHELLVGGLLTFYEQVYLSHTHPAACRQYNLAAPLWVFIGSSVNAVFSVDKQKHSDVAAVVAFLHRFLAEPDWAVKTIGKLLHNESGFRDANTARDIFHGSFKFLKGQPPEELYGSITRTVFHGAGGVEVWQIKGADGEFGLRVPAPAGCDSPYFGVVNIGDGPAFRKLLAEELGLPVKEDQLSRSLFAGIDTPASRVNVLIGAKKFTEGWSSWRVSAMGLLNIGRGEGSQIIQLFGRGVRLKGSMLSLKRSAALPECGPHPAWVPLLETLNVFGWNADYVEQFRRMLEEEGLAADRIEPDTPADSISATAAPRQQAPPVPRTLAAEPPYVIVDMTPFVQTAAGVNQSAAQTQGHRVPFDEAVIQNVIDWDALYREVLVYKQQQGYDCLFVPRSGLLPILAQCTLLLGDDECKDPRKIQAGALFVLRAYLDQYCAR